MIWWTANEFDSITIGRSRRFPLRALDEYVAKRLSASTSHTDLPIGTTES